MIILQAEYERRLITGQYRSIPGSLFHPNWLWSENFENTRVATLHFTVKAVSRLRISPSWAVEATSVPFVV